MLKIGEFSKLSLTTVKALRFYEKEGLLIQFQMLPYPDTRNDSKSCRKYTDTPMWNSTLSDRITPMTNVDKGHPSYC